MGEYLFPAPGSVQRRLLDFKSEFTKRGDLEFSEDEAVLDVMLMLDQVERGTLKRKHSQRFLAKRWGWPKTRVQVGMPKLEETAQQWRTFYRDEREQAPDETPKERPLDAPDETPDQQADAARSDHSRPPSDHLRPKSGENDSENGDSRPPSDHSRPPSDQIRTDIKNNNIPKTRAHARGITLKRVIEVGQMIGVGPLECEHFFAYYENEGWDRVKNLKGALKKWLLNAQYRFGGTLDELHQQQAQAEQAQADHDAAQPTQTPTAVPHARQSQRQSPRPTRQAPPDSSGGYPYGRLIEQ